MINLAKGLNPAMLRVGGTCGDFLLFERNRETMVSNGVRMDSSGQRSNFTMTSAQWDTLNKFVKSVEMGVYIWTEPAIMK